MKLVIKYHNQYGLIIVVTGLSGVQMDILSRSIIILSTTIMQSIQTNTSEFSCNYSRK